MARPESHTVPYFPFTVKNGKTLFLLEDKYGCKGTGFFTNVLRILSNTPDHHICLRDEVSRRMFFAEAKCDEESALDMINMMVLTGKLDRELWEKKQVIFSEDFRQSITDAYKRRSNKIIEKDNIYFLYGLSQKLLSKSEENNQVNVDGNPDNSHNNPQSKVKESKGEESKTETLANGFNHALSELTKRSLKTGPEDIQEAQKLIDRGVPVSEALEMIPKYFTCKAWFLYDRSDAERKSPMYSLRNFVQHYTELVSLSAQKKAEPKRPKICPVPGCGNNLINGDCFTCGYRDGDDLSSASNIAYWKRNIERRQNGNSS